MGSTFQGLTLECNESLLFFGINTGESPFLCLRIRGDGEALVDNGLITLFLTLR